MMIQMQRCFKGLYWDDLSSQLARDGIDAVAEFLNREENLLDEGNAILHCLTHNQGEGVLIEISVNAEIRGAYVETFSRRLIMTGDGGTVGGGSTGVAVELQAPAEEGGLWAWKIAHRPEDVEGHGTLKEFLASWAETRKEQRRDTAKYIYPEG
jgi:hypothetical protein